MKKNVVFYFLSILMVIFGFAFLTGALIVFDDGIKQLILGSTLAFSGIMMIVISFTIDNNKEFYNKETKESTFLITVWDIIVIIGFAISIALSMSYLSNQIIMSKIMGFIVLLGIVGVCSLLFIAYYIHKSKRDEKRYLEVHSDLEKNEQDSEQISFDKI